MKKKSAWRRWMLGVAGLVLAGCTDVALRPGLPEYMTKLAIPVFQNRTAQPGLENDLTQQINQEFLIDGRMEIAPAESADAVLQGTVIQYILQPLLLDVHNTPQQYKLRIILRLELKDIRAGKNLWTEDAFEENTIYYVANSLGIQAEDEQAGRKRVLQQLASHIVRRVVEGF